jgi:hypothetical protein
MQDSLRRILDKALSARFIIAVGMTGTFCILAVMALMMFYRYVGDEKTLGLVREIVMFLLGSFCTQVGGVIASYFNRTDRAQLPGGENK